MIIILRFLRNIAYRCLPENHLIEQNEIDELCALVRQKQELPEHAETFRRTTEACLLKLAVGLVGGDLLLFGFDLFRCVPLLKDTYSSVPLN